MQPVQYIVAVSRNLVDEAVADVTAADDEREFHLHILLLRPVPELLALSCWP